MISRWVSFGLLLSCVLLFSGLGIILIDPLHFHLKHRQTQRAVDTETIATSVVEYAQRTGSIPSFSAQLQQLGTLDQGCQLHMQYCEVTEDKCNNANFLMGKDVSLPSDLQIGSYYKTGYAARYNAADETVTITACGAETKEISSTRSLHGLLKQELKHAQK